MKKLSLFLLLSISLVCNSQTFVVDKIIDDKMEICADVKYISAIKIINDSVVIIYSHNKKCGYIIRNFWEENGVITYDLPNFGMKLVELSGKSYLVIIGRKRILTHKK